MNIILHRTPESEAVLVQVKDRYPSAQLFVDGQPVTTSLFSMKGGSVLTAKRGSTHYYWENADGERLTREDVAAIRKSKMADFGVSVVYQEDEPMEVSSLPNGVSLLGAFMSTNFPIKSETVYEDEPLTIIDNVAKNLGVFVDPLINISGLPEVAMYVYNRNQLRASYHGKAKEMILKYKAIISSDFERDDWSIYYHVFQGAPLQSIKAVKVGGTIIGDEAKVLSYLNSDIETYEAKLQDLRATLAPTETNKVVFSHLAALVKVQNDFSGLEVKQKSYRDWVNLRERFAKILEGIRKDAKDLD